MKRLFLGFEITQSITFLYFSTHSSKHGSLSPVEMIPVFRNSEEHANSENDLVSSVKENLKDDEILEPLAKNLRNTPSTTPYRVIWYAHDGVTPAKKFVYWACRRLRELPLDWQGYYRRMLRQEVSAARFVNQPWDCFMMVVDGYVKAKWVLRKYDVKIDESLIQKPYNNFWEETTHEERVWAHRRSLQMKELQALQRDEDELIFGANMMDRREVTYNSLKNVQTGMQGGTPVHAHDMPSPTEAELSMSPIDEEISSALMGTIDDDKLWNPVLRSRIHTQKQRDEVSLYSFEDEDDGD
ncbi:unnamed protein product [Phytomonas sp. Hart1]|nr:unnamed protein product [Phytomonas sp. Hart1]|eukprot:CCW69260.1 unnamed protein product [Phytomonas sp. isolate Hart1]